MKEKSLKTNAIWNFVYTGSNIIFPIITGPYVSRVLGATNLGKVDFARSFVQWFVIFAAFGITNYGVRAISQVRDTKKKMGKVFSELFLINLLFSILAIALYYIVIFNNSTTRTQLPLFIVMSFSLLLNAVNIDWFYQGIEEYDYITKRNILIKISSLVLIFFLVNDADDYILYAFISVLGIGLSGLLNVVNSRKYVKFTIKDLRVFNHLRYLVTFFLSVFVVNLYTNLDKTLLGFIDTAASVAFLTRGKMVIQMAGTVSTSIATVAMPRASYYLKNDFEKYKDLMRKVPNYMLLLTIPMSFGIFYLSSEIMLILGGEDFIPATYLLKVISVVVVLSTLASFLQQQVIVASGNEKIGLIVSIISSIVSISANVILIPKYSYYGAGFSYVLAEFSAVIIRYIYIYFQGYKFIKLINYSSLKYLIASITMALPIYLIKQYVNSTIITFVLSVISGVLTYIVILMFLREDIVYTNFKKIKSKINY